MARLRLSGHGVPRCCPPTSLCATHPPCPPTHTQFDHQRLYLGWDTLALVRRLSCFWLSLLVSGADYLALVTWSGLVLATHDLKARRNGAVLGGWKVQPFLSH